MESAKRQVYLRAKAKVEALKGFHHHLIVFVLINTAIILVSANVFSSEKVDFSKWTNYITTFFWAFGLISHGIYVFFILNTKGNFLKRWEEKKIRQFLEEDNF